VTDPLDAVTAIADAVLLEGYLLYPYRASAQKNALRWQFGVLVPPEASEALAEPSRSRTECVIDVRPGATLRLRLRFLVLQTRTVTDPGGTPCDRLEVDCVPHLSWDEGLPHEVDAAVPLADTPHRVVVDVPAETSVEPIRDASGVVRGYCRRSSAAIRGHLTLGTTPVPGPYGAVRLRLDVVNESAASATDRASALRTALISAHTVLALDRGAFLSSADPPEWAAPAVRVCTNEHSWPLLAGPPGDGSLLLASPIILSDHPQLAPESPTNLFDGTENDEILALRTLAMTEEEKREARATDPRAAHIVDAIDAMGPEMFERLHGTVRPGGRAPETPWWDPGADASVDPESDSVEIDGVAVARDSAVILVPGRGADAQDEFLRGAAATVAAVVHDVDGGVHVAVTLDDDPAADLQRAHGRYRYFRPDELAVVPS
jgi:hypothetical protein